MRAGTVRFDQFETLPVVGAFGHGCNRPLILRPARSKVILRKIVRVKVTRFVLQTPLSFTFIIRKTKCVA